MSEEMLTVKEAAEMMGVSGGRVRQLMASGRLEGTKRAKVWFIPRSSVEAMMERREAGRTMLPEGYMSAAEMARRLDVSRERVRQILNEGRIPSEEMGGSRAVREEDVEAYMRQVAENPPTGGRGNLWDGSTSDTVERAHPERYEGPTPDGYLTASQVAERLNLSTWKVQEMMAEDEIPTVLLEPTMQVVEEQALEEFIADATR